MHFDSYLNSSDRKLFIEERHLKAVNWSRSCRTAKLGRARMVCTCCGEVTYIARSCNHRFCALCGVSGTNKWAKETLTRLMNCKHHHIVFTLPKPFRGLSKKNENKLHNILFKSSTAVINEWFKERCNLRVGSVSVLHTAGSDLKYHPHVHMIVSRGGYDLRLDKYRFIEGDYLCKNEILGNRLKKKFGELLIKEYEKGNIELYSNQVNVLDLKSWLNSLKDKHWIVNIEKPLEDIKQIVNYVGRYTKRACISEYKLESVSEELISFSYNDYKNTPRGQAARKAILSLKPHDFLDQLLQHVPTKGYRMVRYGGLYNTYYLNRIPANLKLAPAKEVNLESSDHYEWGEYEQYRKDMLKAGHADPLICPHCKLEKLVTGVEYEKNGKILFRSYEDSS